MHAITISGFDYKIIAFSYEFGGPEDQVVFAPQVAGEQNGRFPIGKRDKGRSNDMA